MEKYDVIINSYLNFFGCHLLEACDIENSKLCYDSVYSYLRNYDKNMKEVIYELHIPDVYTENLKDIIVFYKSAINCLRNKLRKELNSLDLMERKKVFYLLAAYQGEFHSRINLVKNGANIQNLNDAALLERGILELVRNQINVNEIRCICAIDKNAIQLILQESIEAELLQNDCEKHQINIDRFCNIYGCALTIIELMGKRSFLQTKVFDAPAIRINNGILKFEGAMYSNIERYINICETDMIEYDKLFSRSIKDILDNNFYKVYGFKIDMVSKIASSKPVFLASDDLVIESNYATIVGEFVYTLKCTIEEAEKMFSYLCIDESKRGSKKIDSPEKDENRIFEKCILKVDEDRYLYSQVLLEHSYRILERKLMFNLLDDCKGINESIIRKKVKEKFVEEIQQFIEQQNVKVLRNIHKLNNGNVLSNEVDVMYALEGVLYVVECKDVSFRFTPAGFALDVSKEREFIKKLHKKIESVKQNIEYFEEIFSQKVEDVEGCLVYRTANFVTEIIESDQGISIVSAKQFKERFMV